MNKKSAIKRGMMVQVMPFEYEQHLIGGAVANPPRLRRHNGYRCARVSDVFTDGTIDVIVGKAGYIDTVPVSACRIIQS